MSNRRSTARSRPGPGPDVDLLPDLGQETKSFVFPGLETKVDSETGIVEAIVAVTGNVDEGGDRILAKGFQFPRNPVIVWSHDLSDLVAKVIEYKELLPGDAALPADLQAKGFGGLWFKAQFDLQDPDSIKALRKIEFHEGLGWSIGYRAIGAIRRKATADMPGGRDLPVVQVFEASPLALGMNAEARTLSVKAAGDTLVDALPEDQREPFRQLLDTMGLEDLETKTATPVHETSTVDTEWDGPANATRVLTEQGVAYYRGIYGWQDPDGDIGVKETWRFIHHEVNSEGRGGAANVTAASTAIGILNGGRGVDPSTQDWTADRAGIHAHMAKHLLDSGVDEDDVPPLRDLDEIGEAGMDELEIKVWPPLAGSQEELQQDLRQAATDWAIATFGERSDENWWWVGIEGTFANSVIVQVEQRAGDDESFRFPYVVDAAGVVSLGTPTPVEVITTVEVADVTATMGDDLSIEGQKAVSYLVEELGLTPEELKSADGIAKLKAAKDALVAVLGAAEDKPMHTPAARRRRKARAKKPATAPAATKDGDLDIDTKAALIEHGLLDAVTAE